MLQQMYLHTNLRQILFKKIMIIANYLALKQSRVLSPLKPYWAYNPLNQSMKAQWYISVKDESPLKFILPFMHFNRAISLGTKENLLFALFILTF